MDHSPEFETFWRERHLCTLSSLRPDGTLHVVPVGAVIDLEQECAWVITSGTSRKVRNIEAAGDTGAPVSVCQIDGRWWSTLEGTAVVRRDPASVAEAVRRYAERYRQPRENAERVAIRIAVRRCLGNIPPLER